jgi:hypothetical protein
MRNLSVALCAVVLLGGCGLIGADETLEQADKAESVLLEESLRIAVVAEEAYFAQHDEYTSDLAELNVSVAPGIVLTIPRADKTTFCVQVSDGDALLHRTPEDDGPVEGPC